MNPTTDKDAASEAGNGELFDEEAYLRLNPDVARAVANGEVASGRQHFLKHGRAEARFGHIYSPRFALLPIVVMHIPRSGSTLLMHLLARHPQIVVAAHYPYEVKVATYYAHAAHVLTSKGDHQKSGSPTEFMRDLHSLSFNPFNHPSFADVFADAAVGLDYFNKHTLAQTREFCRKMGNDFYRILAFDQQKLRAAYFAEKCEINPAFRAVLKSTYPGMRELILVRDLRDVYCSYRSYFASATQEYALRTVGNYGRMLAALRERAEPTQLFIRYEDCIRSAHDEWTRIYGFLGLESKLSDNEPGHDQLFRKHATTASPEASIGRWKVDLVGAERDAFAAELQDFLELFDYAE